MWVKMMVMYEGRMMPTEEVLRIRNNPKAVIETPSEKPKEEIKKQIVETPKVETEPVITDNIDELEILQAKYKEIFGRKANPNTKIETLKEKIAQASEA